LQFFKKWWTYQEERFPLKQYLPMAIVFSLSAVSYSAILRNAIPNWDVILVAFITSFCTFLLLRVADEFKDFEEDSKYRPYRPVPRGLIKLNELKWLGIGLLALQFAGAFFLYPKLVVLLLIAWLYLFLMTKEFFIHEWLKAHPFTYMWSHMIILPLIDFYNTACDWLPINGRVHWQIIWFLIASFFNGAVIEIGRKIRAKVDEEEGVETYTFLWGNKKAISFWLLAMLLTMIAAMGAAVTINFIIPVAVSMSIVFLIAVFLGRRFLKNPITENAKVFEGFSGIWVFSLYLVLGIIPLIIR